MDGRWVWAGGLVGWWVGEGGKSVWMLYERHPPKILRTPHIVEDDHNEWQYAWLSTWGGGCV